MSERGERAELATLYLLGHRGAALRALAMPQTRAAVELFNELCDAERGRRARALSVVLSELLSELALLELGNMELS
ncbi:MAG TPA: hypothetical protein VHM70_19365 [Polyangiaceae bacterium]|jgi:hypothetical protein|nr:hypothetical protein [Polyangiaceae bacterium]